jgi:hypothetical protein
MRKRISAVCSVFLLIVLVLGSPVVGLAKFQKLDDNMLKTPIDGSRIGGRNIFQTLEKLALVYRIPVGFEDGIPIKTSFGESTENRIALFKGTLESFLNYLLQVEPGYSWQLQDGVINVFPTNQGDPKLSAILDTPIKEFTLRGMSGVMGAGDAICQTPEVASKLKLLVITSIHYYQNNEIGNVLSQVPTVKVTDMKVRDVLNALLINNHGEMWTAATWGPDKRLLTITLK